ncbi:MAG: hypothetical protein WAQ33_14105 [Gaiellaceae bacterium]
MANRHRAGIRFFLATAVLAAVVGASVSSPSGAFACSRSQRIDHVVGFASTADSAKASWVLRQLGATDWASGGHTNQTIWVGTDNSPVTFTWVEIGATQGFHSQNVYTYYTADAIRYPYAYHDLRITSQTPSYGVTHTFIGTASFPAAGFFMLIDNNQFYEWYGHSQPVPEYAVGFETTCGESAQVNRTFVSNLYTRRYSDYAWIQSDHGSLESAGSAGYIAWCSQPYSFRHWLNTTIDSSICA